jgi:hypothetical protein
MIISEVMLFDSFSFFSELYNMVENSAIVKLDDVGLEE